jgi:uncharacterized protein (UPF0332 family)
MTQDAQRKLKSIKRCEEALSAAETLLEEKILEGVLQRCFYAMIHAVILIQQEEGIANRDPGRAEELFTPGFVGERGLPAEMASIFTVVRQACKSPPHHMLIKYSTEDVVEILRQAERFVGLTRVHLRLPPQEHRCQGETDMPPPLP